MVEMCPTRPRDRPVSSVVSANNGERRAKKSRGPPITEPPATTAHHERDAAKMKRPSRGFEPRSASPCRRVASWSLGVSWHSTSASVKAGIPPERTKPPARRPRVSQTCKPARACDVEFGLYSGGLIKRLYPDAPQQAAPPVVLSPECAGAFISLAAPVLGATATPRQQRAPPRYRT